MRTFTITAYDYKLKRSIDYGPGHDYESLRYKVRGYKVTDIFQLSGKTTYMYTRKKANKIFFVTEEN